MYNTASITQPVDVDISDLSYKEAEFGESFTISMNLLLMITSGNYIVILFLVDEDIDASPGKIILIPNSIVNATVITWDRNYSCECLI